MTFAVGAPAPGRARFLPVAAGIVFLVGLAVGVGVGLLWMVVAPRIDIIRVEQGFIYADSEPEQAVAADGWFVFLGLAAGLLLALAAWVVLRRHRGLAVLAALVLGSLVGAWLGWWLGVQWDGETFRAAAAGAPVGTHLQAPLSLGMTGLDHEHLWPPKLTGVIWAQALAAAIGYTTFAGFSTDPLLRSAAQRRQDALEADRAQAAYGWPASWPTAAPAPGPDAASSGPVAPSAPPTSPAPPGSA